MERFFCCEPCDQNPTCGVDCGSCAHGPKTWLVGESNPYGSDPYYALYPDPPGCSGWRLMHLLRLTEDEYLSRFERRNLLRGDRWSARDAALAAKALLAEALPGDRLILLGTKVTRAFGLSYEPLTLYGPIFGGCHVLIAPHPSGRNQRAWSDRTLPARLRAAVAALDRAPAPVKEEK